MALLLPIGGLFRLAAALRRRLFLSGLLRAEAVGVPVIVVGNITAGGTGKTPLVIWLVKWLRARGHHPGVVSRGYGGRARGSLLVEPDTPAALAGDEPCLIRGRTGCPVAVGRDRVAAARRLLALHPEVDILVSDDGLQHYRLHRDIELAVIDAAAAFGNGWPIPAGPMREPASRLATVDAVLVNVSDGTPPLNLPETARATPVWHVRRRVGQAYRLAEPESPRPLAALARKTWLAAAGIGRPEGFFAQLRAAGLSIQPRVFPDHHVYAKGDLPLDGAVLMTEKDAVKWDKTNWGQDWWAVMLDVEPEPAFADWLSARLGHRPKANRGGEDDAGE